MWKKHDRCERKLMDIEVVKIISDIRNRLFSELMPLIGSMTSVISVFSTVYLLVKRIPLMCVKVLRWNERKVIKGILVTRDIPIKFYILKVIMYILQMLSVFGVVLFFIGVIYGAALFRGIWLGEIDRVIGNWIFGSVIFGCLFLSSLLHRKQKGTKNILEFICVESILAILLFSVLKNDVRYFYIMTSVASYLGIIIIAYNLRSKGISYNCNNTFMTISRYTRITVWTAILFVCCMDSDVALLNCGIYIWGILSSLEYLVAISQDKKYDSSITVHLKKSQEEIKSGILECYGNRINYINYNHKEVFVAFDEVLKITRVNNYAQFERRKEKELKKCILKGEVEVYYQDFRFISETWISFRREENGEYKEEILHIDMLNDAAL